MRGLIDKLKRNLADFGQDESGMGVIEVILIILGILTPYYGVSIKCIT